MTRLFERDARRRRYGDAVTMEVHMARSDRTVPTASVHGWVQHVFALERALRLTAGTRRRAGSAAAAAAAHDHALERAEHSLAGNPVAG
jgi:hypothetical protein